ncbi:hypothetical protein ACFHYO_12420 [Paracoccus panacisoli]|uniref:Uncharacterized protein n=1 Tax=Paracoccus panacisoli TaxID=1510163 RepID=A0ABV6T6Q5_9RHOB|nr:hypothetical protein [Paracoccus sanguinis]QJD17650.1 hypothetical protein HGN31_12785 [Paracoccus sanguinis]
MFGIVLWSSACRRQAVVWCEDHGALAYLAGPAALDLAGPWPHQGATVEVTTACDGELRRILTLRMLGGETRLAERLTARTRPARGRPMLAAVG